MADAKHTETPWYVGAQNDMLYIVDKPPRPAPADYPYDIPNLTVVSKMMGPDFSTERANASLIVTAVNEREALLRCEEALRDTLSWANQRCPCVNETPDPCPLCGASVENLEACKSAENTMPRHVLLAIRAALTLLDEARR